MTESTRLTVLLVAIAVNAVAFIFSLFVIYAAEHRSIGLRVFAGACGLLSIVSFIHAFSALAESI